MDDTHNPQFAMRLRDWFAAHLGVDEERKVAIYVDLSSATTLKDVTYWLQILFAAGIATLGLVLNSPAVIIGAMLISPLMGPILSGGLALATGDVILGLRAIVNLAMSCLAAVTFAVLLVALLPFKEMTNEIAARTQPTTLDLLVALFSGAIGSIATCKQVKGIVTSIPGVAIAVALMPPLCVVGYGIGFAFSVSGPEGMRVARGGALLFFTNLVAITFTAMIVFIALHIDSSSVRQRIEEWRSEDPESGRFRGALKRLHVSGTIRRIGGLPGRLIMIAVVILVILIPLAQSFNQLKAEIARQQEENRIRRASTELWQQNFARMPDGQQRSFIDQLSVSQQDGKVNLQMRVFTNRPFEANERREYAHLVAARLVVPLEMLSVQLVEIPTTSSQLVERSRQEKRPDVPPTVAQLQATFQQGLESALTGLRFPPPAQMLDYQFITSSAGPSQIDISYLSDHAISQDAASLIVEEIRLRLIEAAQVKLQLVEDSPFRVTFGRNQAAISPTMTAVLDLVARSLQSHRVLSVAIVPGADEGEPDGVAEERGSAIKDYLTSKWEISESRIVVESPASHSRDVMLKVRVLSRSQ